MKMRTGVEDRHYWVQTLLRIATPVLEHASKGTLKARMPVEGKTEDRPIYTHLEAVARLLAGMAPWLETGPEGGEEGASRKRCAELARQAIAHATDPLSPDYMNFKVGSQPIVDTAFLAHAILRAPTQLWSMLDDNVKRNVVQALQLTRRMKPFYNNWLLFSAMIETTLYRCGEDGDPMRIDYAIRQHEQWYMGDGMYSDGPEYHADYYNSFVIHPMMVDVVETMHEMFPDWKSMYAPVLARARRYASQLERSISPEGTFPAIGRSIAYRYGAFQLLSQMALRGQMEEHIVPAQVRSALTLVIRRMTEAPGTFDDAGWLTIGFCGHQPEIGELYISTGSLYLCSTVFLPLGLTAQDPFWQGEPADWTSKKAWSGQPFIIDHAYKE